MYYVSQYISHADFAELSKSTDKLGTFAAPPLGRIALPGTFSGWIASDASGIHCQIEAVVSFQLRS